LPTEFDGLALRTGFVWANDDYLITTGLRTDPDTNEVLERVLVAVRWDGTGARRLSGEVVARRVHSTSRVWRTGSHVTPPQSVLPL
jgi:hypothetical protein